MSSEVEVINLAECQEHLDLVVQWNHEEWSHLSDRSFAETQDRFTACLNQERALPATLVAMHRGVPIGVGSLREQDNLFDRPNLAPWIDNVYVIESARGQGVGALITGALVEFARNARFASVYLLTEDKSFSLYRRVGFAPLEVVSVHGMKCTMMIRYLR